jgi:DNA-binding transcriptional LysR family regulator
MQPNWDDLKVVLAVARSGSMTQAAEALGMDQSTCSRRLGAIEAGLGTILFLRSKGGMAATETGELVINRAAEIERRMLRMTEELSRGPDGPVGTVRLIGNSWTLERLAGAPARRLLREHPRLDLRLIPHPPRLPTRSDPTMSLWFDQPPKELEFAINLGEVPYAFYRSRTEDPKSLPWVAFNDDESARLAHVQSLERSRRKSEKARLASGDSRLLMSAVAAGVGKGLLPMCLAAGHPDLVRLDEGPPELVRILQLHLHPDTVQTQRVQVVTRWLREEFTPTFGAPSVATTAEV